MSIKENLVEMKAIAKRFAHVYALKQVDFSIRKGEVHSLLGENGAGKSTLIKVLMGVYPKDEGEIIYNGKSVNINSQEDAMKLGIACIFQELSLVPTLSVAQNIMLGKEKRKLGFLSKKAMNTIVDDLIKKFDFPLKSKDIVETLSVAQMQMVEILKALSTDASLIIMDEPTASLSQKESEMLFSIINQLRERGVSILYISHRLEEVFQLSDRITVLRDGSLVGVVQKEDIVPAEIIKMMIGKELSEATASRDLCKKDSETVLDIKNLTHLGSFEDVTFQVNSGEVVVLSGLVGSGRTEVLRSIFGADPIDSGEVLFKGKPYKSSSVSQAIKLGMGLIPEDRRTQGFAPLLSGTKNVAITNYDKLSKAAVVNTKAENQFGDQVVKLVDLRPANPSVPVGRLSGGNQQKIVLGKWLTRDLSVILIDEPTVGIDVGAKDEIYNFIEQLAKDGVAVLLVSSDIAEVLRVATRIIIMKDGGIVHEFDNGVVTQEDLLMAASGMMPENNVTEVK